MSTALYNIRHSLRRLADSPGFTLVAVMVLGLGVCAMASIFHLAHGLFLAQPLYVEAPEELIRACVYNEKRNASYWTHPDYAFFRENLEASVSLVASSIGENLMSVSRGDMALSAKAAYVSSNYFAVLRVKPTAGRFFLPNEDKYPGETPVVLVSRAFSERVFGDAEAAINAAIEVGGYGVTIVGVVPTGFHGVGPQEEAPKDLWLPMGLYPVINPESTNPLERGDATSTWLEVIGRLGPDSSLAAAQTRADAVTAALADEVPAWSDGGERVELLSEYRYMPAVAADLAHTLTLLAAAVSVVLVVACANMALLLLGRVVARRREFGIQLALGAQRRHVVALVLTEVFLLALAGGGCGLLLSFWGTNLVAAALPYRFPLDFMPSLFAAASTITLTLALTLLFCTIPALLVSRSSLTELVHRGSSPGGGGRIRDGLVVAQTALAILLVTGAAVFIRSYRAATAVELGFEAENRLVLSVDLGSQGYDGSASLHFLERALNEVGVLPGVLRASATAMPPFTGLMTSSIGPEGVAPEDRLRAGYNAGGPRYFETMGIALISGRDFTTTDRAGAPSVVAINETAANRLWPGTDPLNRNLTVMGTTATVVAVVGDTRFRKIGKAPPPYAYRPLLQTHDRSFTLVVETAAAPATLVKPVEEILRSLDPRLALPAASPMTDLVDRVIGPYRLGAKLVSLFGALALALAMVGLYGTLLHGVIRRKPTLGVRMALGASAAQIAVSVVRRAMMLGVSGLGLGLGTYWFVARFIESSLFQVEARDLASFGIVLFVLLASVVLASSYPAWQAARVDPISILREE